MEMEYKNLKAAAKNLVGVIDNKQWERLGSKTWAVKHAIERCEGLNYMAILKRIMIQCPLDASINFRYNKLEMAPGQVIIRIQRGEFWISTSLQDTATDEEMMAAITNAILRFNRECPLEREK